MRTVLLAGGFGTRAYPYTASQPKPMMPVAGKPIIRHVMDIYARQGFTDFVLSVGYLKEVVIDYFENRDLGYTVEIVDTGEDADTGDRIGRLRDLLTEPFMATYSDGVCDVDLGALKAFHEAHSGDVTLTSVPLKSQYGTVDLDGTGCVQAFHEKPILPQHRINAGYFVMSPSVFDDWPDGSLEQTVLPHLAKANRVFAYSHTGFFKSMDTMKDQRELDKLISSGQATWMHTAKALA
ncbi:sugar phosphate nucleotidyltransferase [Aliiroseovarius sp. PrR006]|uniref:nucleotidyltransferase family protein n=1 Tax=Aliiroseovarius sp. PrR006 TaxID=2706883 RepID=UPI0013D16A70|nr:sugar phosphate nucleotidyltransferase [Aliiroseovarius sp. PrR006]NDW52458.1 NTP transferase domain-containing protein [Aliiroseovarius sp. PrR006]